jgi:uncharacterized protein (DUF2141 family)
MIRVHQPLVLLVAALCCASAGAADLEVELDGVKPRRGEIRAALFDNQRDFEASIRLRAMVKDGEITTGVFTREEDFANEPAATLVLPAQDRRMTLRFTDLQPGTYALALFQDLDGNQRLDIQLGGATTEPWGISNDAGDVGRDPNWDEARFEVPAAGARIVIHLRTSAPARNPPAQR